MLGQQMQHGKIWLYQDLEEVTNIAQILPTAGSFAILFLPQSKGNLEEVGHWVVLLRGIGSTILYFDPEGHRPDKRLSWVQGKHRFRKVKDQDEPHLSMVLNQALKDGFTIKFNSEPYQTPGTDTCGKWVVARVLHFLAHKGETDGKTFKKWANRNVDEGETLDEMIIRVTNELSP